jgi:hypothetical protein
VQRVLPLVALFATKALELLSVDTKSRLPTLAA